MLLQIDFQDGYFKGLGPYAVREVWRRGEFWYSRDKGAWVTDRLEAAQRVNNTIWTAEAIWEVHRRAEAAEACRIASYAAETAFEVPVPEGLHPRTGKPFEIAPYQRAGVEFCLGRDSTLLADAPGIGKTLQAIGVSNCSQEARRILVISPASLKVNWKREWSIWDTRGLTVGIAEASRDIKVRDGEYKNGNPRYRRVTLTDIWPDTEVVIINPDILSRFEQQIKSVVWDLVVVDEAHSLKTADSGRTLFILGGSRKENLVDKDGKKLKKKEWKVYHAIKAKRRLFLTGTPMMNRPIELWPLVKACDPEGLGRDYKEFVYRYCGAWWDSMRGKFGSLDVSGATNLVELGQRLRSAMMIRRSKKEVMKELPDKSRHVVLLESPDISDLVMREDELSLALKLYESTLLDGHKSEDERDQAVGDEIVKNLENIGFSLKKPDFKDIDLDYAAAVLGLEVPMVEALFNEIAEIRRLLGLAKLSAIIPWVKNFLAGGEKLVVFAYHVDVVEGLRDALEEFNPAVIYGKTPVAKRQDQVDRFQDDENCRVIILNIDAGGVGYTLTRSADVAFAEGDWVPTKLLQAEDRVHRRGQTAEKIMIFYLVANGSLDARIAQSAKMKEDNICEVMDT